MKVKLDEGAFVPTRAHETDAGLDIRSKEDRLIEAKDSASFRTGVHVQLPKNTCGLLVSKSGLLVNHGIISTGLIDEGYTGEIVAKLFNLSGFDYEVKKGDKITQMVVLQCCYETLELVKELSETARGDCGFGSTGR